MDSLKRVLAQPVARPLLAVASLGLIALVMLGCGGSASSDQSSPKQRAALAHYRDYLRENGAELSRRVEELAKTIKKELGEEPVPGAESAYAPVHVPYGHIEPIAQLYPPLQRRIDGLEEEVPPAEFGGFHEIEKMIFWENVTAELGPVVKRLDADIETLRERIGSAELQPDQIVAGANDVVGGIVGDVFPGNAERWSHLDLLDAAAEIEGVDEAFEAVKPSLAERNPELAKQLENQLREALGEVGEYGTLARDSDPSEPVRAGTVFIRYDQVLQEERWAFAKPFKRLAELLSEAEGELADS